MAEENYTFNEEKLTDEVIITPPEDFIDNNINEDVIPIQEDVSNNSSSIILTRQAFDKEAFNQTVNTEFTQLGVVEPDLSFFDPNLATVGDFFNIYNNLFILIPKTGPNSHTTLIESSTEWVGYQANQVEIQALLDEIAELREQNLQLTLDIGNVLGAKQAIDKAIDEAREVTQENQ
tara:strand:- start:1093 stop:1623 length:531 start_codon:yes stop_codon:yes gene_type:complete